MKIESQVSGSIEVMGDCAYVRPAGRLTLEEAVNLVDETIKYVCEQRIPKLLFNGRQLFGFRSPSLPERYFTSRRWAATAQGRLQLAVVIRARYIDPEKFGVTVARNSGLNADVFVEELEALAWLMSPPKKR